MLIDRIYEAAVLQEGWEDVLAELGRVGDAHGGGLFLQRNDQWFGWRQSPGMPPPDDYIRSGAAGRSLTTPTLVTGAHPGFVGDTPPFRRSNTRTTRS